MIFPRYLSTESEKVECVTKCDSLSHELSATKARLAAIETDLTIEREWRTRLEENSIADKARVAEARMGMQNFTSLQRVKLHAFYFSFFVIL